MTLSLLPYYVVFNNMILPDRILGMIGISWVVILLNKIIMSFVKTQTNYYTSLFVYRVSVCACKRVYAILRFKKIS